MSGINKHINNSLNPLDNSEKIRIGVNYFTSFVFNPALKTITFTGIKVNSIADIFPITNASNGKVIFSNYEQGKSGTLNNNVLTLNYNTSKMNANDSLIIDVIPSYTHWWFMGEKEKMGLTSNSRTNGEDMWRGNDLNPTIPEANEYSIPTPQQTGEQISLVCEDSGDNATGNGIRAVRVHYIRAIDGKEYTEDVQTNGTTEVILTDTDITFINDMYAVSVGSNHISIDNIKLHKTGVPNDVYCMIFKGGNKSLVPIYKVPSDKFLILESWSASEAKEKRAVVRIRSTDMHGELFPNVFCFKDNAYIQNTMSGTLKLGNYIPSGSVVKVSVWMDQSGGEGSVSAKGKLFSKL